MERVVTAANADTFEQEQALLDLVRATPPEGLPRLAGMFATASAAVLSRLSLPAPLVAAPPAPSRLLTVPEAAEVARTNPRWILRHTKGLACRRDLSRKEVRLEEAGFKAWLTRRGKR